VFDVHFVMQCLENTRYVLVIMGVHNFTKSSSHLQILGTRWVT